MTRLNYLSQKHLLNSTDKLRSLVKTWAELGVFKPVEQPVDPSLKRTLKCIIFNLKGNSYCYAQESLLNPVLFLIF